MCDKGVDQTSDVSVRVQHCAWVKSSKELLNSDAIYDARATYMFSGQI